MKLLYSLLLYCTAFALQIWNAESACQYVNGTSDRIYYVSESRRIQNYSKCWYIEPPPLPEGCVIKLQFEAMHLNDPYCDSVYIQLSDNTRQRQKVCQRYSYSDVTNKTFTLMGAVNMTLYIRNSWDIISFEIKYDAESVICASKSHFRCSSYKCIYSEKVCDGVEDCENGLDENECDLLAINGTKESRIKTINWLMKQQKNFGWGKNTHRAVTSLYLTDAAKFRGKNVNEEIIVKELQLKLSASLLRNSTDPMSVNELSMYLNALLVTCHDVRNIFSEDLMKILSGRAYSSSQANPGAYLTLCSANWGISENNVYQLVDLLIKDTKYPFALEIQAMTIMALTCFKEKQPYTHGLHNVSNIYNETIESFMLRQKEDGSFGNAHTTAMVTQALVASGEAENSKWDMKKAMYYLMKNLNSSSVDFLSAYLTLPLFNGKTLLDVSNVHCGDYHRKLEDDEDILDLVDRLGATIHVQYSLYIGDNKNIIHNIYLKVPEKSTVYDVMKIAQMADPKYKFSYHEENGHVYIYAIAGLTNDMEAGKYWLFYTASKNNTDLDQITYSPDQIAVKDKEHLIIWYKSANI